MKLNIADMLTYRRAHDSAGEAAFIRRYIRPVAAPVAAPDGTVHAYMVTVGTGSRAAFCAHTDSVHNRQLPAQRQKVAYDSVRGEYFVADPTQRDCLGADDAAGCYVLLRMIAAGVPGLYVFFRGEERGGIGSGWIAANRPELFAGVDYAVQFDRRGTESVITEMMCGRTCSDEFARSLGSVLGMGHRPDNTGSFTDTAHLAGIVPECTNISVGYDWEHSARETLDGPYLEELAQACIEADWGSLRSTRKPGEFGTQVDDSFYTMTDDEIYNFAHWSRPDDIAELLISLRNR